MSEQQPATTAKLPVPGDTILGKYRIVRSVGEGGMGIVFEAENIRLNQKIAIKMVHPEVLKPEFIARFGREARAAAKLKSRHAVRVVDVAETEDGLPFMVMEFLEGHDLATEIESRSKLPVAEAVDYVLEACEAMAEAHTLGIVHRDLKPSNLFLAQESGQRVVKVCDFGISKIESDIDLLLTATQTSMGTPVYMSPEQVRSSKKVDARTDVWSLAVILYESIAGRPPFEGNSAASLGAAIVADPAPPLQLQVASVPSGLEAAIMKALSKDPQARYASAGDFGRALVPFGRTDHVLAISAGRVETRPRGEIPSIVDDDMPMSETLPAAIRPPGAALLDGQSSTPSLAETPPPKQRSDLRSSASSSSARSSAVLIGGGAIVLVVGTIAIVGATKSSSSAGPHATADLPVTSAAPPPSAIASSSASSAPSPTVGASASVAASVGTPIASTSHAAHPPTQGTRTHAAASSTQAAPEGATTGNKNPIRL